MRTVCTQCRLVRLGRRKAPGDPELRNVLTDVAFPRSRCLDFEVATMMPARLLSPAMLGLLLPAAPAGWPNFPNWLEGDLLLVWGDLGLCAHFLWLAFSPELAVLSSRVPKTHGSPLLRLNTALHCGTLRFSMHP